MTEQTSNEVARLLRQAITLQVGRPAKFHIERTLQRVTPSADAETVADEIVDIVALLAHASNTSD